MTHYALDDLDWIDLGDTGWTRAAVVLDAGESADNPASTKGPIYGPAIVTYDRYADGGIRVHVE